VEKNLRKSAKSADRILTTRESRMLKHTLLAIVAVFAFAQTASAESPSAPAAPQPPVAPVAPAPAPAAAPVARREEIEGAQKPSLADRIKAFTGAHAGTAALTAQLATLTHERDAARTQLATITAERDDLRRQLADVEAALTGQQNIVKATAAEIASAVGIPLEKLPAPAASAGTHVYDQWLEAKGSAKNTLYREHREKIRAEAARRGMAI
jgi:septal ring factor EnvC (AmiA/AmiB activator)